MKADAHFNEIYFVHPIQSMEIFKASVRGVEIYSFLKECFNVVNAESWMSSS